MNLKNFLAGLSISQLFTLSRGFPHNETFDKRANPLTYQMDTTIVNWDLTCNADSPSIGPWTGDPGQKKMEVVARAWAGAMELAADADNRFTLIRPYLDDLEGKAPNPAWKLIIDTIDPGYLQFFRGSWEPAVKNEVQRILTNTRAALSTKQGTPGSIRPTMDAAYRITVSCNSRDPRCFPSPPGEPWAAVTTDLGNLGHWINFCEPFFSAPRFDKQKLGALTPVMPNGALSGNGGNGNPDLDYWMAARHLQYSPRVTDAQLIFHEITHLKYVGNTNKQIDKDGAIQKGIDEVYGWLECALYAKRETVTKDFIKNADSYAWYAGYGYFARLLGSDPWPAVGPQAKPVTR